MKNALSKWVRKSSCTPTAPGPSWDTCAKTSSDLLRHLIHTVLLAVLMCALPAAAGEDMYDPGNGQDGALTLSSGSTIINLYAKVSAQAAAGDTSITLASNPGIGANDLVMVLQTMGISPEPPSGGPDSIDLSSSPAGRWELARVTSVAGFTLILDSPLLNTYEAHVSEVILVREYTSVRVAVAGAVEGTTKVDDSGEWSLLQPIDPADGNYTMGARTPEMAGKTGTRLDGIVPEDTTLPAPPKIFRPIHGSTTNNEPTYSGNAEPGSTVTVIVDERIVGTTQADLGMWKFLSLTLSAGSHTVRTWATDAAGNISMSSETHTFTVDDTPPVAPSMSDPAESSTINDSTPTYSGIAEKYTTVTVAVDEVVVGITTANSSGYWSFTQRAALADGGHAVKARAKDAADNTSADSAPRSFMVDTKPRSHYDWGCTTSPALPATWALLALALSLGRHRLRFR